MNSEIPPSPYHGLQPDQWESKTLELIDEHPLDAEEIVEVVQSAWDDIFQSSIGSKPFLVGVDIFPSPQIMAFLLHALIPLELIERYSGIWRSEKSSRDKDLVYVPNEHFSVEIKASSNPRHIYGNRSYAQRSGNSSKKSKSGYYLAINFEKFTESNTHPEIIRIRFGWLDHEDWFGQRAATGQQASLNRDADRFKMKVLF